MKVLISPTILFSLSSWLIAVASISKLIQIYWMVIPSRALEIPKMMTVKSGCEGGMGQGYHALYQKSTP